MIRSLKRFIANFAAAFTGRNLIFHAFAIGLTAILVLSGFDWWYFAAHQIPALQMMLFPALPIGGLFPIVVPAVMYTAGKIAGKKNTVTTAFALAQAAILGSLISSLYKAFTGRVQPDFRDMTTDISHGFQFGFLRHGIFWGWPSSHTTIAFSMAWALIYLYRGNRILVTCALIYALYIGFGVSLSIHWFSDFIAGALIGTATGMTVGKSYRAGNEWGTEPENRVE